MRYKLFGIVAACLFVLTAHHLASAQSETPRYEVGAQFTALRLKEFRILDAHVIYGLGARFTYNLTDNVAVEAEGNYFPADDYFGGRRATQGLFGVKAGVRRRKVGVFGKARPGFIRFKNPAFRLLPGGGGSLVETGQFISRSELAFDIGGVVEFYPSRRLSLRTDVGDTIVRFDRGGDFITGRPRRLFFTSHNLQFSTGVSFRF